MLSRLWAAMKLRCPRCYRGAVFRRNLATNTECAVCGLRFLREPGYFTGAMYASYALGIVTTTPVWMTLLFLGQPAWMVMTVAAAQLAISTPVFFVYSRVIWLHLDHAFDPV